MHAPLVELEDIHELAVSQEVQNDPFVHIEHPFGQVLHVMLSR